MYIENPPDKLYEFFLWFFKKATPIGFIPLFKAVHKVEDVTSVIWYRDKEFQVQLFVVPGGTVIPEHTHPNVDSYEVLLGGQIEFSHLGKWTATKDFNRGPTELGLVANRGVYQRVKPSDVHGAVAGPDGGVFMSVQHWLNGVEPHCVAADYDGITMGQHHLDTVKCGNAAVKPKLTIKDVAHLEDSCIYPI